MKQCLVCGSTDTYISHDRDSPRAVWRNHNMGYHCEKCHHKLCSNPKYKPIDNHRILSFMGKNIYLKENPRKGICSFCNKKVGDLFRNRDGKLARIKKTDLHHIQYDPTDPLKHTIELCSSCHRKETIRLSKL